MHAPVAHLLGHQPLKSSLSGVPSSSYSLFEVRLERDFIVFRGREAESTDQLLKGVLVLCLQSPLKLDAIQLRLDGTLRHCWLSDPGVAHKTSVLKHTWPPFVSADERAVTLPAGNYEWPFEYMLPGDTPESVEGIPEASITYTVKATISRGKLVRQLSTQKQLRIIRTLLPESLEFMHSMSIDRTWVGKVDYSVAIPTKAAVFGGCAMLDMRFSPLVKGLEIARITVTLAEIREFSVHSRHYIYTREHRVQRTVSKWEVDISPEQDWQDSIESTGRQGWVVNKKLPLPKRLRECIQDLEIHGIKVHHKVRISISIRNPDGHLSQLKLDMALPIYIFISPNMPLDDQGNLVEQSPDSTYTQTDTAVPPEYGEHVLDQLYEDIDSWQNRDTQSESDLPASNASSSNGPGYAVLRSNQDTTELSQQCDATHTPSYNSSDASSLDENELYELSKVPTYRTAVRTPLRPQLHPNNIRLPDYETAAANTT
ncbi:hypothetical protein NM208_g7244 [Fusarium decemcellulare]|uniref:Uncharacterized protein n=1 Tax=Fusarium decemcellulare TaxID=57161 RepID=A0ACC1S9Z0_9HYPO|nr:hypothetical protein NM208_g7244 [Fusarium decemcellulare]